MARRYSWPAKLNGRPSRRMRLSAQAASGSVSDRVVGLASSVVRLVRYRFDDSPTDTISRLFILHILLDRFDEGVDEATDLGLRLRPHPFFGLAAHGKPLRETLALLRAFQ